MLLDSKDRKILYLLDENSRMGFNKIAKKAGLSKDAVRYRINRLLKTGVIRQFLTVINNSRLGYSLHKIFFVLKNLDETNEKKLISFLEKNSRVVWLGSCDGAFDLFITVKTKDLLELGQFLRELDNQFGQFIEEKQIATILKNKYLPRNFLIGKNSREHLVEVATAAVGETIEIDNTSKEILFFLAENARAESVKIANVLDVSADTVSSKIKKLKKLGIITGFILFPDIPKMGLLHYKLLLSLKNISEKREQELIGFCDFNPNVFYYVKTFGPWDFEIDLNAESSEQFREKLKEIKNKFSDIIDELSPLNIYKIHKFNLLPREK